MDVTAKLLFVVGLVFIHVLFALATLQDRNTTARWVLFYLIAVAFYGALYFRHRLWLRNQRGGVYRGLGYVALMLGALLSVLFFVSVAAWNSPLLAVLVWVVLAVAAYFLHRVSVLHMEEEIQQLQVAMRVPL